MWPQLESKIEFHHKLYLHQIPSQWIVHNFFFSEINLLFTEPFHVSLFNDEEEDFSVDLPIIKKREREKEKLANFVSVSGQICMEE